MLYALINKTELIGLFNDKNAVNNMYQGLINHKFVNKNDLIIKEFIPNSICSNNTKKIEIKKEKKYEPTKEEIELNEKKMILNIK